MAHRIGTVRLKAKALGNLKRQQIGYQILVTRGDVDVAGLERRQPVGVDVGQHARGGAELQQRDVLAFRYGARCLRLDLDDLGIGEPADQVDIVDRKIDHDSDVRHTRRKRSNAGNRDRKNILVLDRLLERLHRRIEAFDMAGHQRNAGAASSRNDGMAFLDGRSDRLFDQHVDAALGAFDRNLAMKMGRRRDRHCVNALTDEALKIGEGRAAKSVRYPLALLAVGIDHPDQFDAGKFRQHARMVRAHDANANNADAQVAVCGQFDCLTHNPRAPNATTTPQIHATSSRLTSQLAWSRPRGDPRHGKIMNTFGINSLQTLSPDTQMAGHRCVRPETTIKRVPRVSAARVPKASALTATW